MATIPDVLTVAEAAAFMRVSRETVYRLAARGELSGRKIGRVWRFRADAIHDYLGQREDHAAQKPAYER